MKLLLAIIFLLMPAYAQEPAAPAEQAKPEAAKAEEAKPEPAAASEEKKAESPVPSAEQWLAGSIDFGYRWLTDLRGNPGMYRSIVNLGEGPRLTGADFSLLDPKKRFFDRIDVRANAWGGDPYNTAHVDARKRGWYDFRFDYRNIAYFRDIPSYANPALPSGVLFSQRTFDSWRRMSSFELDMMPGHRIVPYFSYQRNAGRGTGVTDFVAEGNEYAVPTYLSDRTDLFRGGLRFEFNRWHITVEQGATHYVDGQFVYDNLPPGSGGLRPFNPGNRSTLLSGQPLLLTGLSQQYGIIADSKFTRALVTANPLPWINLFGNFLYSQAESNVRYNDRATGNFVQLSTLLFYTGQQDAATGDAKAPHSSANFGFEIRPLRKLRVIESTTFDRMHNASYGVLTETLLFSATNSRVLPPAALADRLVLNYNQTQVDAIYDLTSRITFRGGYRYVWGDSLVRGGQLSFNPFETGELKRHVGLAGFTVRPIRKLSVSADYEGASSDRAYFRTSLYDYQRARVRARYQALTNLAFQANFGVLTNENPSTGVRYDFLSRDTSLSAFWTPGGGKRISVTAEYTRSTLRSDINYLVPQQLSQQERSFYRDNAHTATALADIALPAIGGLVPKVSLGGSLFVSSGSRPTEYYQPLARLSVPLHKHVYWNTDWRWFGYGEQFYGYEAFRVHAFMTGLRLVR